MGLDREDYAPLSYFVSILFYSILFGYNAGMRWVGRLWVSGFEENFDKVPHRKLIIKLENKGGIQGKLLEWMKDFLDGRKMSHN